MVAVVVLLSVVVAGELTDYRMARATRGSVDLALAVQDFIEELQQERGLTSGLLGGNVGFRDEIEPERRTRQVTCPQGNASANWSPTSQRGTQVIVVKFATDTCPTCPVRAQCTTAKRGGRQLTFYPRDLHHALTQARTKQSTKDWQDKYKLRAGVEGTIHQAVTITGIRHTRYRGIAKTHLQHGRTSRLERLRLTLAA